MLPVTSAALASRDSDTDAIAGDDSDGDGFTNLLEITELTFPGDPDDNHAGDIAICPFIAAKAAGRENTPFAVELTLYLVHAWLHLAGLDDREEDQQAEMRRAERQLMEHLQNAAPALPPDGNPLN